MRPKKKTTKNHITRNPKRTKNLIIKAATAEFSKNGLSGARVDVIAKKAKINKRMLYHYFGNKEGLYGAVIEDVYENIWKSADSVKINEVSPILGVKRLIRFVWNNYKKHPEYLRLFHEENTYKAEHIINSERLENISPAFVANIALLIQRGINSKDFSAKIDASKLYTTILSMCYFYLSHQYTLSIFLNSDFKSAASHQRWARHVEEVVLCYLRHGGTR